QPQRLRHRVKGQRRIGARRRFGHGQAAPRNADRVPQGGLVRPPRRVHHDSHRASSGAKRPHLSHTPHSLHESRKHGKEDSSASFPAPPSPVLALATGAGTVRPGPPRPSPAPAALPGTPPRASSGPTPRRCYHRPSRRLAAPFTPALPPPRTPAPLPLQPTAP